MIAKSCGTCHWGHPGHDDSIVCVVRLPPCISEPAPRKPMNKSALIKCDYHRSRGRDYVAQNPEVTECDGL